MPQRGLSSAATEDHRGIWFKENIGILLNTSASWSVYFKNLETNWSCGINSLVPMDTMSVIKIPLLVSCLDFAYQGKISLNQKVVITRDRKRLGTGILRYLDDGSRISLRDALTLMISLSDNTATDILYDVIGGPEKVNELMKKLSLPNIITLGTTADWFKSLATFMDPKAASYSSIELYERGFEVKNQQRIFEARRNFHFSGHSTFGWANAEDVGQLLEMIFRGTAINSHISAQALKFLSSQLYNSRIPRYLPSTATVYHKTGDFDPFIANDVGIVKDVNVSPFVLSVFCAKNESSWGEAEEVISRIAISCYENLHILS
jgi:beta-lactamase class A